MVGLNQRDNLSSALLDSSNSLTLSCRMARISSGELQACSCAASGCTKRSFLVFFLYAFRAALKMDWKLEVDVEEDGA